MVSHAGVAFEEATRKSFLQFDLLISARERLQALVSVYERLQTRRFSKNPTTFHQFGIPAPNFQLGDEVVWYFYCDDDIDTKRYGKTFKESGFIIGMVWNPGHFYKDGWIYTIQYTASELYPPQKDDNVELHEEELIAKKWGTIYE